MDSNTRDFRKMQVWSKAHRLVLEVYKQTSAFPKEERYGLTSQLRRSASSIPTNIAEGCGRGGEGELGRFLTIALGSICETEYHLILASDLGYLPQDMAHSLIQDVQEIGRMANAYLLRLRGHR